MVKTLSGLTNLTVSDTLKVKKVSANDSLGTAGQVLTTNGTATYWDTPTAEAEVNTALQYVWTNTNIFNANVTVNAALIANGSSGTVGQVLHSNGTAIYWAIDDVNQNTTYDLLAVANTETNKGIIRLKDVNNSNDDVYVTGAGGVVVSSNASHILITGQSGDITGVSAGDGLTGTTTSGEALISVLANTGIFANATGTYVNAAYIATLNANNASYLGGVAAASYLQNTDSRTLSGNLVISGTQFNPSSNTVLLGNSTARWVLSTNTINSSGDITTAANITANYASISTDLYVGRNVAIQGNLTIYGTTTSLQGNTITFSDNMLYLNQGILATITNVSGNGTRVTFTANNNYQAGWDVSVTGVNPSSYNGTYQNIFSANATHFEVSNTNTASYISGGTARGKTDQNPDLGLAAGYNDGTYHHTGIFRDASDGYWKVFDGYLPEPDANINIDTSNNSFNVAGFWSGNTRIGNTTVYTSISNFGINFAASGYEVNPTGARFGFYNGGGTPQTYMQMPAGGEIVFWNSGTGEVMRIANNNNVGIGETNPQRKLTVRADSTASITAAAFYNADTTNNNGTVFSFRTDTTGTGAATFQELAAVAARYEIHDHATRSGSLDFFTVENGTGANRLRVAANGNIGISNTTPSAKLTVNGDILASGDIRSTSAGGNQGNFQASMSGSGAYLHMVRPGYQAWYLASPLNSPDFYISESSGTVADSKMYFKSGGNVGIGTTSPLARLDINDGYLRFADGWGLIWGAVSNPPYISGSNTDDTLTFGNAGSERMRITAAGNVGIGTVSPAGRLDVAGNNVSIFLRSNDTNDSTLRYYVNSVEVATARGKTGNIYAIETGGTERMRILSNGDVGIGQSTVTGVFGRTVSATGPNGATYRVTGATVSGYMYASDGLGYAGITTETNHPLVIATNSTERMRITAVGDVGIGTTSPLNYSGYTSLTIGSTTSVGLIKLRSSYNSGNGAEIYQGTGGSVWFTTNSTSTWMLSDSVGNVGIGTTSPTSRLNVSGGQIRIQTSGTYSEPAVIAGILAFDSVNGQLTISSRSNGGSTYTSFFTSDSGTGAERMRITGAGNVGIGTISPTGTFDVQNNTGSLSATRDVTAEFHRADGTYAPRFQIRHSTTGTDLHHTYATSAPNLTLSIADTECMRLTQSGNIGIGTDNPLQRLHVNSALDGVALVSGGSGYSGSLTVNGNGRSNLTGGLQLISYNTGIGELNNSSNQALVFSTNSTERARITAAGNLGIGTSSPVGKLSVYTTSLNSDTDYNGQNFGLIIGKDNGENVNDDGNGIVFTQQYATDAVDSSQVRTGAIIGYKGQGVGSFGGGLKFKVQPAGANPMSTVMTLTKEGNVGIGTTTPAAKLDVNGEIRALSISGYNLSNNAATIDTGLTPTDFTILEAFGSANPNADGSANYRDPIHLYIYRGTGWNGSAVTEYVYAQSVAPPARSAFPSGSPSSSNENMSVVWVKAGVESDTCPLNDATYSLRIKISNYATTSYFNLRIVRRF
jgi:hypothetical protein